MFEYEAHMASCWISMPSLRCFIFFPTYPQHSLYYQDCMVTRKCSMYPQTHSCTNTLLHKHTHVHTQSCIHNTWLSICGAVTSGGGQRFDRRQWTVASQTSRNMWNNNCNDEIIWELHCYDSMRFCYPSSSEISMLTHARTHTHTHSSTVFVRTLIDVMYFPALCCKANHQS